MPERLAVEGIVQLDERNVRIIRNTGIWTIVFVIIAYSMNQSKVDLVNLISGLGWMVNILGEMYPPNISGLSSYLSLSMETIAIGVLSTIIGTVLAFPVCFLAARNTTTGPVVYHIARSVVTFFRTLPEIVFALAFVIAFGMGPMPGILCLTLSTFGMLTKFYSEAVESIDPKPLEALNATGGHRLGVIRHAVLPQVIPVFISYTLYMLDENIRGAVTLGIVGAGGVGFVLYEQLEMFHYTNVATILILIVIMVALVNRMSAHVRNGVIEGTIFRGSRRKYDVLIVVAAVIVAAVSIFLMQSEIDYTLLVDRASNAVEIFSPLLHPDFTYLGMYLSLMLETITIAISGTAIAILLAVPLALLMARNITKNRIINNIVRECTNLLRAIPELMYAILFVAAVGLGPFAGVLAIALHTAGILGEFYAGAIENIDPKPVEAVEATGARFIQRIRHAIIPQIFPVVNSNNLYMLDRNIRASSILGIVGGGGIGIVLLGAFHMLRFQQVIVIIGVIFVAIFAADFLSAYIRKKVV